jgi:hypothetical protein
MKLGSLSPLCRKSRLGLKFGLFRASQRNKVLESITAPLVKLDDDTKYQSGIIFSVKRASEQHGTQ